MAEPLSKDQIDTKLKELNGWVAEGDKLHKEFSFKSFKDALTFIVRIGFEAEDRAHHPEIRNVYSTVNISLSTHDAGNKITEKDTQLAKIIESLYQN